MNRTEKTDEIARVKARFDGAAAVVLLDFQGMKVETVTQLRREFKKAGVEYRVVKNTLIRQALKDTSYQIITGNYETRDKKSIHGSLRGMTGVAWCKEDPSVAAKVIEKFKKDAGAAADKLKVKAGLLGGQVREREWVEKEMGKLPGLKETQATVLATLQAPAQNLVAMINAPAQNLVYLLANWISEREKAEGAPAEAT